MRKRVYTLVLASVLSLGITNGVMAQENNSAGYTPFMLSIVDPLQLPPSDFDVGGLKISLLYGKCADFLGLDIGIVSHATGDAEGLHVVGLANIIEGDSIGLHVSGANYVQGEFSGLQIGILNNCSHVDGLQIGVINITDTAYGLQIGLINVIKDNDMPFFPIINGYF